MPEETSLHFKLRIWLECGDGFSLGPGKAELLQGISTYGSLKKAAEALGMSYRRAWGRVKKAEKALGRPLVEKTGGNKTGYQLTPFTEELLQAYSKWMKAVESYALKKAEDIIPARVNRACEKSGGQE